MRRRLLAAPAALGLLLAILLAGEAQAFSAADSWVLRLEAPAQSMWGPGASQTYSYIDSVVDSNPLSLTRGSTISVEIGGDLGSVSGNLEGIFRVAHDTYLAAPGTTQIRLGFDPLPGESKLQTILGGFMRTTVQLDVHTPIPIHVGGKLADLGIQVRTDLDFDYASGVTVSSGNSQKLAGLGLDLILASIAVEVQLNRTVFFEPGFLQGMIFMEHLDSGRKLQTPFQADTNFEIHRDLLLDRPGFWEISFGEIELSQNLFYQTIGGNVEGRISVAVLGDLGRVGGGLAFPVGSPFALQFDPIAKLGGFIVRVPEPGSILLAVLGLLGLLVASPRRRG